AIAFARWPRPATVAYGGEAMAAALAYQQTRQQCSLRRPRLAVRGPALRNRPLRFVPYGAGYKRLVDVFGNDPVAFVVALPFLRALRSERAFAIQTEERAHGVAVPSDRAAIDRVA